tara:strand:+ start:3407 stop:3961 length:555 start_codon:yes stop_codon:yes gene_type:complete
MKNKAIFIEGKKIYLTPFTEKEVNRNYLKWINDENISNHIEANRFPNTLSDLKSYYIKQQKSKNSILFAIYLKKNKQHIGNCSLTNIDWINRKAQYGRLIGITNQKTKGCGTEALKLLQAYAFKKLNLNSLWTGVNEKNIGSIKSNLKSGMKKVGSFPESIFYNGKFVKMICFCITKKQFENQG